MDDYYTYYKYALYIFPKSSWMGGTKKGMPSPAVDSADEDTIEP